MSAEVKVYYTEKVFYKEEFNFENIIMKGDKEGYYDMRICLSKDHDDDKIIEMAHVIAVSKGYMPEKTVASKIHKNVIYVMPKEKIKEELSREELLESKSFCCIIENAFVDNEQITHCKKTCRCRECRKKRNQRSDNSSDEESNLNEEDEVKTVKYWTDEEDNN